MTHTHEYLKVDKHEPMTNGPKFEAGLRKNMPPMSGGRARCRNNEGRVISKVDTILFTYLPYFILFCLIPCHLDALKMSKSGLGLYNVHKL